MNAVELTKLFVEYQECYSKLQELEEQIKAEVLLVGESQKIAGVKATYYAPGFETPDYGLAARQAHAPQDVIEKYSTTTISTKWAEVCKELNIYAPPGAEKPARVVVKA